MLRLMAVAKEIPSNFCNTMLILWIGKGFLINLLFTSQKLLRKYMGLLFCFGTINDGDAHSDACCHSSTPRLHSLSISLMRTPLCIFGTGKAWEVGFSHSIFLVPTTILGIVHGICTPMFLAEVAMFLGACFLGNLAHRVGARPLVTLVALVRSFLVGLCIGSFLSTYVLNSLKRQEKQMHVHRCHTFLMKVELILSHMWAHPMNVTC